MVSWTNANANNANASKYNGGFTKLNYSKFSFWCERKIPGTIGTKREKYSGVKAPIGALGGDSGDKVGGGVTLVGDWLMVTQAKKSLRHKVAKI